MIRVELPNGTGSFEMTEWESDFNEDGDLREIDCSDPDSVTFRYSDGSTVSYDKQQSADILLELDIKIDAED